MSKNFINTILSYRLIGYSAQLSEIEEHDYSEKELELLRNGNKDYELDPKDYDYQEFLEFLNCDEIKFGEFDVDCFKIISYFDDVDIIEYLKKSIIEFKQKHKYGTTKQFFQKDYRFKNIVKNIKEIGSFISGATPTFFSFNKDGCTNFGIWRNYLVYYYQQKIFFFDKKYVDHSEIEIHFKHILKVLERDVKYLKKHNKEFYEEVEVADEITENKLSVPQIIKILDKLNIRASMNEKNGLTDFQTTQLLADIFGRTEKSIRNNFVNQTHTSTAENYISELKNLKAKR